MAKENPDPSLSLGGLVRVRVWEFLPGSLRSGFVRQFALLTFTFLALVWAFPGYAAKHATLVIDADSGKVLQETNADTLTYPASLTKMMTLYMTFDALKAGKINLDTPLKVTTRAANQSPTKLGLHPNDRITVEEGILGMVTRSANDAAVAMAETLAS